MTETNPSDVHEERFRHLANLPLGWDSYGADRIDPDCIDRARSVLTALRGPVSISGTVGGGIFLTWQDEHVTFEIDPGGRLTASVGDDYASSDLDAQVAASGAVPDTGQAREPRPVYPQVWCDDSSGPNGIGGTCVLGPGHLHRDGLGGEWPVDPSGDTGQARADRLAAGIRKFADDCKLLLEYGGLDNRVARSIAQQERNLRALLAEPSGDTVQAPDVAGPLVAVRVGSPGSGYLVGPFTPAEAVAWRIANVTVPGMQWAIVPLLPDAARPTAEALLGTDTTPKAGRG